VVSVRARRQNGGIVIHVDDQGPGVPAEDRERIFERFVRGSTARVRGQERPVRGSGIGLALVKHIVESHGGKAWVEEAPRRGVGGAPGAGGASPAPGGMPGASFAISIPVP
jgi:two-component system phosphate regulon sensor histidine kinase PhoR